MISPCPECGPLRSGKGHYVTATCPTCKRETDQTLVPLDKSPMIQRFICWECQLFDDNLTPALGVKAHTHKPKGP